MLPNVTTVDEHIALHPRATQRLLQGIRERFRVILPEATECINYGIPTLKYRKRNIIHYAGYPHHIGVYPGQLVLLELAPELTAFACAKGTVQFPLTEPFAYDVAERLLYCRLEHLAQTGK
jgi:uncharacterized protein YdhG (YjbR/CyaY superfamily)